MATIIVSLVNGVLQLSDNGRTNASHSEQIDWHPGQGVQSVTDISVKTSPPSPNNFWADAPHQNGVNFRGKLSDTVSGIWTYNISCNIGTVQNPTIQTIDPMISVNS